MSSLDDYNGWSNKATWLVNNWFKPESLSDVKNAMYQLEAEIEKASPLLKEFLETNVNWDELEAHFPDDDIEE
jgi:hypothetical protein